MIRVTIEMLKGGVDMGPGENEILGVMLITNDLKTSLKTEGKKGSYIVRLWKKRNAANVVAALGLGDTDLWRFPHYTEVKDFNRKAYHPWNIVRIALNQIAEGRRYV
jgi:hypothetical protein